MKKIMLSLAILMFAVIPWVSAAHYVVGTVNGDGNGKVVTLYNPAMGISNNITDVIGPTGNSNADNIYMIDVEMLYSCNIGDEVRLTLGGSDDYVSVIITGAGYDMAPNLTIRNGTASFEVNVTLNETVPIVIPPVIIPPVVNTTPVINNTVNTTTPVIKPKPVPAPTPKKPVKKITQVAMKPKITYSWVNKYSVLIKPLSKSIAYVVR